ncbi:hypothetical protein HY384_00125 [Candidatus Daviesbacteria bacterium]|nr:hypothetical protein [Candidatus Daviesbacteria bacterium]
MIRLLPFILIPILIISALGYWRYLQNKQNLSSTKQVSSDQEELVEVPDTLPNASVDERVKSLEETINKLVPQVNSLKSSNLQTSDVYRLTEIEAALIDLKARVSALEKATPVSASQASVYIPLGGGGGPWGDKDWYSTNEYEISLDTANYPGYKGMVLEATFRMVEAAGTASIRLYNVTDSSATSSQLDTTSIAFSLKTSAPFTIPAGAKTYKLQVKSSQGTNLYIQSARIKVNF